MGYRRLAIMAAGIALAIPALSGADVSWQFNTLVTGDDPGTSTPWATLDCTDISGGAQFTLSFSADANVGSFLSQLDLNFNGDMPSDINFSSSDASVLGASFGSFVDAGSSYDIMVMFDTSNGIGGDRITPGESVTFSIMGTDVDCADFDVLSQPVGDGAGYLALLHIQGVGIDNQGSSKVAPGTVPEPASMAALGLGALGLLARRRRAKA
jgi:hypothetical protein